MSSLPLRGGRHLGPARRSGRTDVPGGPTFLAARRGGPVGLVPRLGTAIARLPPPQCVALTAAPRLLRVFAQVSNTVRQGAMPYKGTGKADVRFPWLSRAADWLPAGLRRCRIAAQTLVSVDAAPMRLTVCTFPRRLEGDERRGYRTGVCRRRRWLCLHMCGAESGITAG